MELTSKQRKKLRSLANTLEVVLIVGKDNVTSGVVSQADEALEAHELIKCSVLETSELTAREACDKLCELTGAQGVQVIGRKFVVYRETHRKDVKKIELD
jgi:RNA-binding protein